MKFETSAKQREAEYQLGRLYVRTRHEQEMARLAAERAAAPGEPAKEPPQGGSPELP